MNEDPLRNRIAAINPAPPDVAVEQPTTPSSRDRLERIMNTRSAKTIQPTKSDVEPEQPMLKRASWFAVAAATAVFAGAGVIYALGNETGAPLELSIAGNDAMASCLPLQADILADMSPAFAATTKSVEGETITLEVDRWYAGGDADTVVLHAESGMESLIAGFDFEEGQQYLITASEGNVNFCGYSGLATPELTAVFAEAFPG